MKFYQSPLSLFGILFLGAGIYFIFMMFKGTYPSMFFFFLLIMGFIMLLLDHFIRKSKLGFKTKLVIQSLVVLIPMLIAVLFFSSKII
jgi:hypothetical protein